MTPEPLTPRACACSEPDPVMQADGRFYCHTCSFQTGARPRGLYPEDALSQLRADLQRVTAERDAAKGDAQLYIDQREMTLAGKRKAEAQVQALTRELDHERRMSAAYCKQANEHEATAEQNAALWAEQREQVQALTEANARLTAQVAQVEQPTCGICECNSIRTVLTGRNHVCDGCYGSAIVNLEKAHDENAALTASEARLREALRRLAIGEHGGTGDESDWMQCRLCRAVWRIRESHKPNCLLATRPAPERTEP